MGAYRGWFSLDGTEFANSSRLMAHTATRAPVSDVGFFTEGVPTFELIEDPPGSGLYIPITDSSDPLLYELPAGAELDADLLLPVPCHPCKLQPVHGETEFFAPHPTMTEVSPGLWTPPNGARRFGPGVVVIDSSCWEPTNCASCTDMIGYDDSWPGMADLLSDTYQLQLAPWYTTQIAESGEFLGVWVMKVEGFGPAPVERPVTELVGSGGITGPARDRARPLTFEALLLGCSNAGVEYGLDWLGCALRDTNQSTSAVLRYLTAHPATSGADPVSLMRELHQVVLTDGPRVVESISVGQGGRPYGQGTVYRVTWQMSALHPYAYLPSVTVTAEWDEIARQPINWVHAADCQLPSTCDPMPVLFSADCVPEEIDAIITPPPVCGGCLPVGAIDKYTYRVPTFEQAFRCRETAVSVRISNLAAAPLTLQAFWRVCGTDVRCEDNQWPLQVAGLPAGSELILDGVSGKYWALHDGRVHRPVGIVGTPNGAPWRPPLIDRMTCWDFVVQTTSTADFDVQITLADREP